MAGVRIPQFIKFTISSLVSAAIDFFVFYSICRVCLLRTDISQSVRIFAATAGARVLSTAVNFVINKCWSFESRKSALREVIFFAVLFVLKLSASAALVSAFSFMRIPTVVLKMIVDTVLFFVSFLVQKTLIFR